MNSAARITKDSACEASIVKEHDRLIRYVAIPFVAHGVPLDDLVQEGRLALLQASRTWDGSFGVKLWTYARKFVLGAVCRAVSREIDEPCRDDGLSMLAAEATDDTDRTEGSISFLPASGPSPEEIAELGEDLSILEEEIDALGEIERTVLWKIFGEERDVRAVGEALSISKSAVDRIKQDAIYKLRSRMEARA